MDDGAGGSRSQNSDVAVRVRCTPIVLRGVMTMLRRHDDPPILATAYRAISDLRDSPSLIIGALMSRAPRILGIRIIFAVLIGVVLAAGFWSLVEIPCRIV